jgi:cobalt transporter subunit CbtA
MLRNIVLSAFGAALLICLGVSLLQTYTTEPLILHAEEFEGASPHDHAPVAANAMSSSWMAAHAHELPEVMAAATEPEEWGPADRLERTAYTVLANLVIGFGASLMILSLMILKGDPIDTRSGLLWGVAAFFAVSLLPSLGLPPELPGTPAAEIVSRQTWWLATAMVSAAGLALIVFRRKWWWLLAGATLIVAPHLVGAPTPPSHDVAYPGALAGEFVVASLVVSAAMWTIAGGASAWLHQRLAAAN